MATLDDVDEDEAFIMELMSMHPNDDDIVVEDLSLDGSSVEETPANIPTIFIDQYENGEVSDVRNEITRHVVCVFAKICARNLARWLFSIIIFTLLYSFTARNLFYYFTLLFLYHEPCFYFIIPKFSFLYDFSINLDLCKKIY